ncbi:MAG: UrcA family protein [Steroidobacteraceae bacterium]
MKTSFIIASVLLAGLAGAGVAHADAHARWIPGPVPQMRVSYADLDMTRAEGRATFEQRLRVAARAVCPPVGAVTTSKLRRTRCIETAINGARMQFAAQRALAARFDGSSAS